MTYLGHMAHRWQRWTAHSKSDCRALALPILQQLKVPGSQEQVMVRWGLILHVLVGGLLLPSVGLRAGGRKVDKTWSECVHLPIPGPPMCMNLPAGCDNYLELWGLPAPGMAENLQGCPSPIHHCPRELCLSSQRQDTWSHREADSLCPPRSAFQDDAKAEGDNHVNVCK